MFGIHVVSITQVFVGFIWDLVSSVQAVVALVTVFLKCTYYFHIGFHVLCWFAISEAILLMYAIM